MLIPIPFFSHLDTLLLRICMSSQDLSIPSQDFPRSPALIHLDTLPCKLGSLAPTYLDSLVPYELRLFDGVFFVCAIAIGDDDDKSGHVRSSSSAFREQRLAGQPTTSTRL